MFGSLRKKLEEAQAQLNPFDGNKTAATVRASRNKPAPAQTRSPLSVGVAQPQGRVSVAQPAPQRQLNVTQPIQQPKVTVDPIKTQPLNMNGKQYQNTTSIRPAEPIAQPLTRRSPMIESLDRVLSPIGSGVLRSGVGTAESLSGLYDLATPGKGQNRVGKSAMKAGKNLDQVVEQADYSKPLYKGAQVATDIATFYAPGSVTSKAASKVLPKTGAVQKAVQPIVGTSRAGNIAARTAGYVARPDVASNIATDVALSTGFRSNRGQDINPTTVAMDAGISTGAALGLKAGGAGIAQGAKAVNKYVVQPTTKLVKSTPSPASLPTPRVSVDEQAILQDYTDTLSGAYNPNPRELSDLITQARLVGSKHGVDLTNGSAVDRLERASLVLDSIGQKERGSLFRNEGGYLGADEGPSASPRPTPQGKTPVQPNTRLVSSSIDRKTTQAQKQSALPQKATQGISNQQPTPQAPQGLGISKPKSSPQPSSTTSSTKAKPSPEVGQAQVTQEAPLVNGRSSTSKIQQKTPVVNEGRRAIKGADRTGYGLRESFDTNENVPKELKEVLGAFGNERTVKSNKELWQNAQQRVGTDAAEAMKYFSDNTGDEAVATGYALINRYMKGGNSKAAGEIAMTMAERALEAGRTTQAYALMKRLTPEGSIQYVENKVARYIKQNPKQAGKLNWDDKTRKALYDMADKVNKMPEGRERNLLIGKMQQTVDNIFPSSKMDKAITVWKAGLLTSLRTHERNILGNTINFAGEQIATAPGSIADRIMALRTGKRTLVASKGEGIGSGTKTGAIMARDQVKTGIDVTNSNLKYNINHITWGDSKAEKSLQKFTEVVFRPLGAEDKLFKEASRKNSYYNQALAAAKSRKLKGKELDEFVENQVDNPSPKMMEIADQDAGRATFSHDNVLGDIIREAKGAVRRSSKPGAKGASAVLDILMPFTQVPSGVASQLYAYSPAKLVKSTYDIGKVLVTGDSALQRTAAQGFGRSVVGTSILGAGAYLASKGQMTGQPRDDQEKAQWETQGIKPNSIKVGDRWYGLSSIGPQNLLLLAGAQFEADKKEGEAAFTNIAANLGKNFKDQTFLKGMSSALDAVGDPQRYMNSYIQQQATSVVPNVVKDIARAFDPNERETSSTIDRFKQSIPWASKTLPERKDSYGQTMKNSGVLELVDLFNSSRGKNIPEADLVNKLRDSTGEKIHTPSKAARSLVINGENKRLTAKEKSDYQGYIGTRSKESLTKVMNDDKFKSRFAALDDTVKVKLLDDLFQDVNSAAKVKLFGHSTKNGATEAVQSIVDGNLDHAIELKLGKKEEVAEKKTSSTSTKKKTAKKKSGSKGRGGTKSKFDYTKNLFDTGSSSSSVSKSLRQILESAMSNSKKA